MTSIVVGLIKQKKEATYVASMFGKKIVEKFNTYDEAFAFCKEHAIELMKTGETSAVAIQYERKDKRSSFVILERIIDGTDQFSLLEYEESAYDYVDSHMAFYPKTITKRMMNERYYSFHDFARIKVLTSNFSTIAKIAINIFAFIAAIVFLFYGLHAANLSNDSKKIETHEKIVFNVMTIIGTVSTLTVATVSMISYGYPIYKLRKKQWVYDEIDWRKMNRMRSRLKAICIANAVAGIGAIAYYLWFFAGSDLWKNRSNDHETLAFLIISIITASLFLIIGVLALANVLINQDFERRNLKKYFTPEEIVEYKKWIKFKRARVSYKTDDDFFLAGIEDNIDIVLAKIKMAHEVRRVSEIEEIKEYKEKAVRHYKTALKMYMSEHKNNAEVS